MRQFITRIVALLLAFSLVQEPSATQQALARPAVWRASMASIGPVGAGLVPARNGGRDHYCGRTQGSPLQFPFTSQALALPPLNLPGQDVAATRADQFREAGQQGGQPATPAGERTELHSLTMETVQGKVRRIPPEIIEKIRENLHSQGYPSDDVETTIASSVLADFRGEDPTENRTAEQGPSAGDHLSPLQIIRRNTLEIFDWRLTYNHEPDIPWAILGALRRKRYFRAADLAGLPSSINDCQMLIYKALKRLYHQGLIKDKRIVLNIRSGGAAALSDFIHPPRKDEISTSLMMSRANPRREPVTDRILAVEIFHEMVKSTVDTNSCGKGLDDESRTLIRQLVALNYLIELEASGKFSADDTAAWLRTKGADDRQIAEYRTLAALVRNSNFYSVRLDQLLQYLIRHSGVDGLERRIDRPRVIGLVKNLLDDKEARFYLSSFIRSNSTSLLKNRKNIQAKVDGKFEAAVSNSRHLTARDRLQRILAPVKEHGLEKLEDLKSIRHPKQLFLGMWLWAVRKGGPGFAMFMVCYMTVEDYLISPILYAFGHHVLATIALWVHAEPMAAYGYFLVRRLVKRRHQVRGIPRTEYEMLRQRLKTQTQDKKFKERMGILLETSRDFGQFIVQYFVDALDDPDSAAEPSTDESIGRMEEAIKMLGRILATKRKLDRLDLSVLVRFTALAADPDPWVRKVAAGAIGKSYKRLEAISPDRAFEARQALIGLLNDERAVVRGAAARSLGQTQSRAVLVLLTDFVTKETDTWARIYAVEAIRNIARDVNLQRDVRPRKGATSLVEILIELASSQTYSVELRAEALRALGVLEFATEPMMSIIREALFDAWMPAVKQAAFWAYVRKCLTMDCARTLHEFKNTAFVYLYSQNEDMRYFARKLLNYVRRLPVAGAIKEDIKTFLAGARDKPVAAGREKRPIVFIDIDALSIPPKELFSDPRLTDLRRQMRASGHSVFMARSWSLDRTNTPLEKGGSIDPFNHLDRDAFAEAFKKLQSGRQAMMPILDFERGKKARERPVIPTGGGVIVVLGFRKEIDSLTGALAGPKTVLRMEDYARQGNSFEALIRTLDELAPNPPLKERRVALDRLKVRSLSEITTRFSNLGDLWKHLNGLGIPATQLAFNAAMESFYWVGAEHVTVFSYAKPAKEDDLIWRSDEVISRVGLDDVIHPHFISIQLTEKIREVLGKVMSPPAEKDRRLADKPLKEAS